MNEQQLTERILSLRTYTDSVTSSNVKRIKWDSVTKELVVQFNDATYTYFNVPEAIYNAVLNGQAGTIKDGKFPSVGAAVHQYLIEGGFRYNKGGKI